METRGRKPNRIRCNVCGTYRVHSLENFPKDATTSNALSKTCRICKSRKNRTFRNAFGVTQTYTDRTCLRCSKVFNSLSKGNRICNHCKKTKDIDDV